MARTNIRAILAQRDARLGQGSGDLPTGQSEGQGSGDLPTGQGEGQGSGDLPTGQGEATSPMAQRIPQAPSPDYASMTAGHKAAYTRRMRAEARAGGSTLAGPVSTGPRPAATSTEARATGLVLELLIHTEGARDRISLSFRAFGPDGSLFRRGLSEADRALPDLRWSAVLSSDGSELAAFESCTLSAYRIGLAEIERAVPLMRRVDRMLALARDESEDTSLAFVASTLAAHFRVDRIRCLASDGSETEHKRGAAYVCAHRASEALLAAQEKPDTVQAAA
ncbi:MAG TPA: hypothetical protein VK741_21645 [Acetobacteraceae bacterium]|nr:hypothetical protein [Acetobacteraceae bacterium]